MIASRLQTNFRRAARIGVLGAMVGVISQRGLSQPVVRIDDSKGCESCALAVRFAFTIHDGNSQAIPSYPRSAARLSTSTYVLSFVGKPVELWRFDERGQRVRDEGEAAPLIPQLVGPVDLLPITADRMELVDHGIGEMITTDGRFHEIGRKQSAIPYLARPVRVSGGAVVASGLDDAPQTAGLPLHLIDSSGIIEKSFGNSNHNYFGSETIRLHREVAVRPGGTSVWSAHYYAYDIEEWDLRGTLLRTVSRSVPWFPPPEQTAGTGSQFSTAIEAVRESSDGLLWVVITVPRELRTSMPLVPGLDRGDGSDSRFDTIIEVLDVGAAKLVAQVRVRAALKMFLDDSHVLATRQFGKERRADVWSLSIVTPRTSHKH